MGDAETGIWGNIGRRPAPPPVDVDVIAATRQVDPRELPPPPPPACADCLPVGLAPVARADSGEAVAVTHPLGGGSRVGHGAHVSRYPPMVIAARANHVPCAAAILRAARDAAGDAGVVAAVEARDGAGATAVHHAAALGHSDFLVWLLHEADADPLATRAVDGRTALWVAAEANQGFCCRVLTTHGTDPDGCDRTTGVCVLSAAVAARAPRAVGALLDAGATPGGVFRPGRADAVAGGAAVGARTTVRRAAELGHAGILEVLLARGADATLAWHGEPWDALTPLAAAEAAGHTACAAVLRAV